MNPYTVGILLFDDVEVLDFAGPYEAFSVTEDEQAVKSFKVVTISEKGEMIRARNGLKVEPDYHFGNHPELDVLVIPGGYGAREVESKNEVVVDWVRNQDEVVEKMTSVCTGSFILAEAGLLEGKRATTHWTALDRMEKEYPSVDVKREVKFVDEGHLITSAGISAGIEMALHVVAILYGKETAAHTAKHMEYDWQTGY
ncbi:DJ-1/PfpI family protein [Alkalibacterium thalassium]|uniref:DJ-1/PfpI family protein n=1 Tax=Alkalibacterium thalassium TaxID=426701 RepID=A0A1G9BQ05_9LACT|nr:DJ-1/PfpI family protein [Alkalibacterium thalassium]SDK41579.1 DJ-1/PfpI family protein [Alkalibacterium thalassium]